MGYYFFSSSNVYQHQVSIITYNIVEHVILIDRNQIILLQSDRHVLGKGREQKELEDGYFAVKFSETFTD